MKHLLNLFIALIALIMFSMCNKAKVTDNPLLSDFATPFEVPPFNLIDTTHYLPAFVEGINQHNAEIEAIISSTAEPDFENTILAFDRSGKLLTRVNQVFNPINNANTNPQMQSIARQVDPLLAQHQTKPDDIIRLNHTGTHPVHTDLAIDAAIDYMEQIGLGRKEERLRYLQRYWTDAVRGYPGIRLNTPAESHRSGAIANVGVEGLDPAGLASTLLKDYGIYTVAIDGAGVQGCRITPNVFTAEPELDRLVAALKELAEKHAP